MTSDTTSNGCGGCGGSNYYELNPHGPFVWFQGGVKNLQLDIVGFLAILGEGSVLSNSQVASLSAITFLPRLMPAPQALLRTSRPSKLDPHTGYTVAVSAGNYRDYINHIGHMLVCVYSSLPSLQEFRAD
jgi:hypothetical protein